MDITEVQIFGYASLSKDFILLRRLEKIRVRLLKALKLLLETRLE